MASPHLSKTIPGLKAGSSLGTTTVAAPTAQTSAAAASSPTKTEFDKVVVDLASLYTAVNALRTELRSLGLLA